MRVVHLVERGDGRSRHRRRRRSRQLACDVGDGLRPLGSTQPRAGRRLVQGLSVSRGSAAACRWLGLTTVAPSGRSSRRPVSPYATRVCVVLPCRTLCQVPAATRSGPADPARDRASPGTPKASYKASTLRRRAVERDSGGACGSRRAPERSLARLAAPDLRPAEEEALVAGEAVDHRRRRARPATAGRP